MRQTFGYCNIIRNEFDLSICFLLVMNIPFEITIALVEYAVDCRVR
jgi:hypothetical protein